MKNLETVQATTGVANNLLFNLKKSGSFFTAEFVKKDGSVRIINCRCKVQKYKKGGTMGYNAQEKGLLSVFDMQKMEYRVINLDTLISITFGGKKYLFNNVTETEAEQFIKSHIFIVHVK
jgi:hypothetical protein